jgi:Ankyrin repeats (3 copies)
MAIKAFKWIVCAKRPLRIDELKEAVGIESTHKFWDADKIPAADDCLIRCWGNLLVFDTDDRTIRLAHYTVQQFLLSESARSERFRIRQLEAEIEVGEICVAYLSFSDFETQITKFKPKITLPDIKAMGGYTWSQLPLPRFAAKILSYLWRHTEAMDSGYQPLQIDFLTCYLQDSQRSEPPSKIMEEKYQLLSYVIDNWAFHTTRFSEKRGTWLFRSLAMEKEMQFHHRPWGENHVLDNLPYLALFRWAMDRGHAPLLGALQHPSTGPDLSQYYYLAVKNGQSTQLLRHICQRGYESVLSLFLKVCAVDQRTLVDSRLVVGAVESRNEKVLELLLEHGSDPNTRDEGSPVLCIAARNPHESVARVLLAHKADVKATDDSKRTALHDAAKGGHEAVVRLLIEKGADVKARSYCGRTALQKASQEGHDAVVRLLVSI